MPAGAGCPLFEIDDATWPLVDILQIRATDVTDSELESIAGRWVGRLKDLPTVVVVNDRLDVALATGAGGVHLGQQDLPVRVARQLVPDEFLIGASAHDAEELLEAQADGADYAGLGAFFTSRTKPEARPLDPVGAGVAGPLPGLKLPVLAIGGIELDDVEEVLSLPVVSGIAVAGAVAAAPEPAHAIVDLRNSLDRAWAGRSGTVTA